MVPLCRLVAREMTAVALEAKWRAWLDVHAHITDAVGKRLVVGNGCLPERTITTGAGQVEAKAPRVADKGPGGGSVSSFPREACCGSVLRSG